MKVTLAESAVRDLEEIRAYYDGEGVPDVGADVVAKILERIEGLADFPDVGVKTQGAARQLVCERVFLVTGCLANAQVHVDPVASISAAANRDLPSNPFGSPTDVLFGTSTADQYVVVAVFLQSPLSVLGNSYQLRAVTIVRNEPFQPDRTE